MTLRQLIERLEQIEKTRPYEASDYRITVVCENPSAGGRYRVPILFANSGFDWERGDVILTPEQKLISTKEKIKIYTKESNE